MGPDPIERFLASLRSGWPDMVPLFMQGQCLTMFLALRAIHPQAEAWYSFREGHVYTKIDGRFYDIRGRHLRLPTDLHLLDWKHGDKPHRWPKRDMRILALHPSIKVIDCGGVPSAEPGNNAITASSL